MSRLTVEVEAVDGAARAGRVVTPRGSYPVPCFMAVGTRGAVKTLDTADLEALRLPIVLGNTYHLMLRPGADVVRHLGGLHRFMGGWGGHVLTDSGGYQVFSLAPKVDDEGATFRSTYDGSRHHLSPERAAQLQSDLGADIQMVLDVCPGLPAPDTAIVEAVDRTTRWAARGRAAFLAGAGERAERGLEQAQFGIVQGGVDEDLRASHARATAGLGFDGYAVGGLSVGERRDEMLAALAAALSELPADQPRYLMGVGDPSGVVEAIALGVDQFDCVLPTRLARHGTLLTDEGRLNLRNARFARDPGPVDASCACSTCGRWSRAYLRHLLAVGEPSAARLLTIHNLAWLQRLVARTGEAIRRRTLGSLRREVLERWT